MKDEKITLTAEATLFYSPGDESAFFTWLKATTCVHSIGGSGRYLDIVVSPAAMNEYDLRELLALFYRYGVDMKQLSVFSEGPEFKFLRDRRGYWYRHVFE